MECNIDEQGVRFRRVWCIMMLLTALMMFGLALWSGGWWVWLIAGICAALGLLALYEVRKRWCVLRAMGIKTRL